MYETALLLSVGPAKMELARLTDFFQALLRWESAVRSVVLIDDSIEPRDLQSAIGVRTALDIKVLHHPRRGEGVGVWGGLTEGVLLGLECLALQSGFEQILKIDTDALIIGKFATQTSAFFGAHPKVGMVGLYDRYCDGSPRLFEPWNRTMQNYALPVGFHRKTPDWKKRVRLQIVGKSSTQRGIIKRARAKGYIWGEHCLGGAYMLRAEAVRDMQRQGLLKTAEFWRTTLVSEDVVVSAYLRSCGWDLAGLAAPGEVFGIAHKGLPALPQELVDRGYSIIHSLKNDTTFTEAEIRQFFRDRVVLA